MPRRPPHGPTAAIRGGTALVPGVVLFVCVASGCSLERPGFAGMDGSSAGPPDARVPARDARVVEGGEPRDATTDRDSGPSASEGGSPPLDADPMPPPDTGPPDLGPPPEPDSGPPPEPDSGPPMDPDGGPTDPGEEACRARFGDLPGFVYCGGGIGECSFNADTMPSCDVVCISRGAICLRAYDNPNEMGRECEANVEEGDDCMTARSTELCVCTLP